MSKYRKKPVVIDAFRIGIDPWEDWFHDKVSNNEIIIHYVDESDRESGPFTPSKICCSIHTLEGIMVGDYGDYIVRGVSGEVYPVKPDIFIQTYELAECT